MRRFVLRLLDRVLRAHLAIHRRVTVLLRGDPKAITTYTLRPIPSGATTRIVHVNGNFLIGGTTQLMVDLIERASDDYAQSVLVPDAPVPPPYAPVALTVAPLERLEAVYREWQATPPALVHVQYWVRAGDEFHPLAIWYDALYRMCERLHIPVVQNVNVPTVPHPSPAIVHNVFVSQYVMDEYDTGTAPGSVIYPGSDFDRLAGEFTPTDDVIGMVYRLERDKLDTRSIEVFIEAVRRRPSVQCLIVGGGHFLDLYQRRVVEEGMSANFIFTGYVAFDDLPALYRRLSVAVAPVHNESFGQVTPFAMSLALPVAGFDIGALSEQLGGRETLVPAGDVDALADLIVRLLEDRPRRLVIGAANRQRALELFSVEAMVACYRSLYAAVIGR